MDHAIRQADISEAIKEGHLSFLNLGFPAQKLKVAIIIYKPQIACGKAGILFTMLLILILDWVDGDLKIVMLALC